MSKLGLLLEWASEHVRGRHRAGVQTFPLYRRSHGTFTRSDDLQGADFVTVDVSVGGEWSFSQTLRHLVMATDTWLGRAILEREQPFHPLGQPNVEYGTDGNDMSIHTTGTPPYAEVLEVRAGRVAMVRDYLSTVTPNELTMTRNNPHNPDYPETTLSCLQVILGEEWEHHRYAVRDLKAIGAKSDT